MSIYLFDLFFIFIIIFIIINRIFSSILQHTCSFSYFLEYVLLIFDDNVDEECEQFSDSKSSTLRCYLALA